MNNGTAAVAKKSGKLTLEPLGSGAIESTCRQYQCRFKRSGQFWTMDGDESLMCLETFWRNDRWHELYPHAKLSNYSSNSRSTRSVRRIGVTTLPLRRWAGFESISL